MSNSARWPERPPLLLWNYSFLGRFGTEISGVSSFDDSPSLALSSVSLVHGILELSVLSAGGLGIIAGFSLGVFNACKIDGISD